jgi:hypothetical protein
MLPDLRFLIGAVLATVLLGVTAFGLMAALQLSHQSKLAPLETSRLLAYTPDGGYRIVDVPSRRFENPFANIPVDPNPVLLQRPVQQPAEPEAVSPAIQIAVSTRPAASPEPAAATPITPDADMVDERAVVDPPLPQDNDEPATAADSAPASAPAPPAEAAPAVPTLESAATLTVAPTETAPAAPAPAVEIPAITSAPPEVEQVGSIPAADETVGPLHDTSAVADLADDADASEPKARPKRAVRKRAKAARRLLPAAVQASPFGFTGYALNTTSSTSTTISPADRPAQGFWPPD